MVRLYQGFGEGQAYACSAYSAVGIDSGKACEYLVFLIIGDTYARIGDGYDEPIARFVLAVREQSVNIPAVSYPHGKGDASSGRRVFECIGKQIICHLLKFVAVHRAKEVIWAYRFEIQIFPFRNALE